MVLHWGNIGVSSARADSAYKHKQIFFNWISPKILLFKSYNIVQNCMTNSNLAMNITNTITSKMDVSVPEFERVFHVQTLDS